MAEGTRYLGRQTPSRTMWSIRAGGYFMRVIYDELSERLVTCLPCGEDERPGARDHRQKLRRLARKGRGRRYRDRALNSQPSALD